MGRRDSIMAEVIRLILFRSTARGAVFLERRTAKRGIELVVGATTRVKNLPREVLPILVRRSLSKRRDKRLALGRAID